MKRVLFHPEAKNEMIDAARYYDVQKQGLGRRYLTAVQATIRRIQQVPGSFPKLDESIRRGRVERFPLGIIFREMDDHIEIIAIIHFRRQPGYWKKRVGP